MLKQSLSVNVKTTSNQMEVCQQKPLGKKSSKKTNVNLTCSKVEGIKSSNLHVIPCLKNIITTHQQENFTRKQSKVPMQSPQNNRQLQMQQQTKAMINNTTIQWFTWIPRKSTRHQYIKKHRSNRTTIGWNDSWEKGGLRLIWSII